SIYLSSFSINIDARSLSTGLLQQIPITLGVKEQRVNAFTSICEAPTFLSCVIIAYLIVFPVYGSKIPSHLNCLLFLHSKLRSQRFHMTAFPQTLFEYLIILVAENAIIRAIAVC
ncbi:MAG: hypothetical protein EZS28_031264, partial [Streblomastix strix]